MLPFHALGHIRHSLLLKVSFGHDPYGIRNPGARSDIPFLGALAGCSARRSERRVASHTSEEQRRNAPARAAKNGILAFSASLSAVPIPGHGKHKGSAIKNPRPASSTASSRADIQGSEISPDRCTLPLAPTG